MSQRFEQGRKALRRGCRWQRLTVAVAILAILLQTAALLAPMQPAAVMSAMAMDATSHCDMVAGHPPASADGSAQRPGKAPPGVPPCPICIALLHLATAYTPAVAPAVALCLTEPAETAHAPGATAAPRPVGLSADPRGPPVPA